MADPSRLTPKAAANTADCTELREFRTRGHYENDFGDIFPITETPIAVSENILRGGRLNDITYNFFRRVVRFSPVLS